MKHIDVRTNGLVWYNALHFGQNLLSSTQSIKNQIDLDLANSQLNLTDLVGKKLVICFTGEGHDAKFVKPLIDYLKSWPVVDMLVVFNSIVDTTNLPYKAVCYKDYMINHGGWFDRINGIDPDLQIDYKFICLMRRPSPSRARLANKLLNKINSIKLSFGSMSPAPALTAYQSMIPDHALPILIDGIVDRISDLDEHDQTNPVFQRCLFNIVVESSSQTDSGVWHSQFVTEKTFKAFGLRQIPIWMAVPGLVDQVRDMGFDVFDDLIDHSYDNIVNETQRQDLIVEQIQRLDQQYGLDQCQHLRNQLQRRLENNYQLLISRLHNSSVEFESVLKKFIESSPQQLLIFGDSWPHGDELKEPETAYGQLLAQQLGIYSVKNYSSPGTGIAHMVLQLKQAVSRSSKIDTKKTAVFFLSGQERFLCYHNDTVANLSIRGPRINPENDSVAVNQLNDLYYRYFYTDQLRDFLMNTNLIALQSMCQQYNIDDYYIAGWQHFDFWPEVNVDKIYAQGQISCRELLDMKFDDRDGVVYNNPYFNPNLSHPNQLGHQQIAQVLFDWITSKTIDTGPDKYYNTFNWRRN